MITTPREALLAFAELIHDSWCRAVLGETDGGAGA